MTYCTEQNILDRFDDQELIELTNDTPGAIVVDSTVISKAIEDAEAEINSYCAKHYQIPLSPIPKLIVKMCIDITVYNLFERRTLFNTPEDIKERYNNTVKLLDKISKQMVLLGADSSNPVTQNSAAGFSDVNSRVFTRDDLKSY